MSRPKTSAQLQILADIAKARETARKTAAAATTPKEYKPRDATTNVLVSQVATEGKVWVKMKVRTSVLNSIPAAARTALGILAANTAVPATTQVVDFEGNHKKVMRIHIYEGLGTPIVKHTPWGTRVVKHIGKVSQVPCGNDDLQDLKTAFTTFFASAEGQNLLGATGSQGYAALRLGKETISVVEKSSVAA